MVGKFGIGDKGHFSRTTVSKSSLAYAVHPVIWTTETLQVKDFLLRDCLPCFLIFNYDISSWKFFSDKKYSFLLLTSNRSFKNYNTRRSTMYFVIFYYLFNIIFLNRKCQLCEVPPSAHNTTFSLPLFLSVQFWTGLFQKSFLIHETKNSLPIHWSSSVLHTFLYLLGYHYKFVCWM